MKDFILIQIIIAIFCQSINGQNAGFYYKYDFKSYLNSKTINAEEYVQKINKTIKYPGIARENKIEGKLDLLIINNGNNQSEIILKKHGLKSEIKNFNDVYLPYVVLEREIKIAFKKVDEELLMNNKEKFITEFSVLFEMESSNTFSEKDRSTDFLIIGKKVKTSVIKSH